MSQILNVPRLGRLPVMRTPADHEGRVASDVAHKLQGAGFLVQLLYHGRVQLVVRGDEFGDGVSNSSSSNIVSLRRRCRHRGRHVECRVVHLAGPLFPERGEEGTRDQDLEEGRGRVVWKLFPIAVSLQGVLQNLTLCFPRLGSGPESSIHGHPGLAGGKLFGYYRRRAGKKEFLFAPRELATALQLTFVADEPERRGPQALCPMGSELDVKRLPGLVDGLEVLIIVRY